MSTHMCIHKSIHMVCTHSRTLPRAETDLSALRSDMHGLHCPHDHHTCPRTFLRACLYACTHALHMRTCTHALACAHLHVRTHLHARTCMHSHASTHACTNAHAHTHAHTHTYMHTHARMHAYARTRTRACTNGRMHALVPLKQRRTSDRCGRTCKAAVSRRSCGTLVRH